MGTTFQDTKTGDSYVFLKDISLDAALEENTDLPKTLSSLVIDQPGPNYVWNNGNWEYDIPGGLLSAQTSRIVSITNKYNTSLLAATLSYTTVAGHVNIYQSDPASQTYAQSTLVALSQMPVPATPAGFYWVSSDNTHVPFTFADIQGLAQAMFAQGVVAFQNYQAKKAAIRAATTVAEVQAITY